MKTRKYTIEDLKNAVASCKSIRQVLLKLNVAPYGGNYQVIKNAIKELNLDTSHLLGQGWNKGNSPNIYKDRTIEDYLSNKYKIQSYKLKNKLLTHNYLLYKCYSCGLEKWLNNPIPLELHHIDGNNANNNLNNLQLLCPNCHALTTNYRGKNITK